jgi:hypothetical protein
MIPIGHHKEKKKRKDARKLILMIKMLKFMIMSRSINALGSRVRGVPMGSGLSYK